MRSETPRASSSATLRSLMRSSARLLLLLLLLASSQRAKGTPSRSGATRLSIQTRSTTSRRAAASAMPPRVRIP